MKKYVNLAFVYAIAALACGVFYREFTKVYGFTGRTTLAFTHVHLFVLGTGVFLLIALFAQSTDLTAQKLFGKFMVLYNISVPFMVVMLLVRGVLQVRGTVLSSGASAAISGIAGIAHILLTVSLVLFLLCLRKSAQTRAA